jgi:hypothetical protein
MINLKIKKICKNNYNLIRENLTNPFSNDTLEERLIKSGAIDLRDNYIIEDLGNGYSRTIPIDENKKFTGF